MLADGVRLRCCGKNLEVGQTGEGKRLKVDSHGEHYDLIVDEILVGAGRAPNVDGLGLEAAEVELDASGVQVDDHLRTTNRRVYAAGDVCSRYKFTHAADAMARIVIQNALFFGRRRVSSLVIPWCTYTDPELAHVGIDPELADEQGIAYETHEISMSDVDRAILDGDDEGLLKVHVARGKDKILGATLVAAHAGEMISEISLAMTAGVGLGSIANVIHPYPTQTEIIKKAGDAYNRSRLTPRVKKLFETFLALRR
jgi:pyruvate/2-oxoglutarate dehydrogenase complex dihydrolipoamide dehydrogenase (E3) component